MVREIVKDETILKQQSEWADLKSSKELIADLLDTAKAQSESCVGLSAIQIGVPKRIIVVKMGETFQVMVNPQIIRYSSQKYTSEEGCLSLEGTRKVERHLGVEVIYTTVKGVRHKYSFTGFTAQIIQHEVDHCNGILI